jgi:hypothetical protein
MLLDVLSVSNTNCRARLSSVTNHAGAGPEALQGTQLRMLVCLTEEVH